MAPETLLAVVAYATAPETLAPLKLYKLEALPINKFALILPTVAEISPAFVTMLAFVFKLPDSIKLVNVPTLVMLGCALVVNVPVTKLAETFPPIVNDPVVSLNVRFAFPANVPDFLY